MTTLRKHFCCINYHHTVTFVVWILLLTHGIVPDMQAQDTSRGVQYYALEIAFGKDSTKTWDGEVTFSDRLFGDEFLYAGIKLDFMKSGRSIPSKTRIAWKGKAEARDVFAWAIPFNKMVEGYTPGVDKFPFDPFEIEIHLKARDDQVLDFNTINGRFKLKPSGLMIGNASYFLDSQVMIVRNYPALKLTDDKYIANRKKYHGYPSIAVASDGSTYTTYTTYYEGMSPYRYHNYSPDNLPTSFDYLAQEPDGDGLNLVIEKNGAIVDKLSLVGKGRDIAFTASVMDSQNNLWVCWSENVNGNKDIYSMTVSGGKKGVVKRVTTAPGPDLHPCLTVNKQGVWLAWQGHRDGNFEILCMNLSAGNGAVQNISNTPSNEWQPAICSDSKGNFAIVWDSYMNGNYDIYCAKLNGIGEILETKPVATTFHYEACPTAVFDNEDRLWIAYEKAGENWGKDYGTRYFIENKNTEGLFATRSIRLICIHEGRYFTTAERIESAIPREKRYTLYLTKGLHPAIYKRAQARDHYLRAPFLSVSSDGHLCLVYKKNADTRYTTRLENQFIYFNGESWSSPVRIGASNGQMHERPTIIALNDGTTRVVQASEREAINEEIQSRKNNVFRQDIWLGMISLPTRSYKYKLLELEKPEIPRLPERLVREKQDIKMVREYRINTNGKTYRILKGDSHRHTSFSGDGAHDGEIEDSYRYGLDVAALDWMNNGDHDCGYNEYHWYLTQKYADLFKVNESFTPLFGYERSCRFPDGHRNIIFGQRGVRMLPRVRYNKSYYPGSSPDTRVLYKYLREFGGICVSHTSASLIQGTDWRELKADTEPVMEIYQGERMSAECRDCPRFSYDYPLFSRPNDSGFFRDALKKGNYLGVIASSDHKSTHVSFAMVYAEEFSRQGIMDGIKKRHTYAATDNIVLDVRMNGRAMMGDVMRYADERRIYIYVHGTGKIKDIVLVNDGKEYQLKHAGKKEVKVEWVDENINENESYYYVRVMQENGELAWSSPIWVKK